MTDARFPRVVSLACHDLRTPLATIFGFARTLTRTGDLGVAARIESDRWEPALQAADTLELATSDDERVAAEGEGETIETEPEAVGQALQSLAVAAARYGPAEQVTWRVSGRDLELAPITADAAPVVTGESIRDLGSLVARMVIEELGRSLALDGETL